MSSFFSLFYFLSFLKSEKPSNACEMVEIQSSLFTSKLQRMKKKKGNQNYQGYLKYFFFCFKIQIHMYCLFMYKIVKSSQQPVIVKLVKSVRMCCLGQFIYFSNSNGNNIYFFDNKIGIFILLSHLVDNSKFDVPNQKIFNGNNFKKSL